MEHKREIKIRYDETVDVYDRRYSEIQNVKYKLIFEKILIGKGQRVLDVGTGTGNLFLFLEEYECYKYGIDLSIKSLKRAREKLGEGSHIDLLCADVDYLPFKRKLFDITFLITVLQNVSEPTRSLQQIKDVIKKNSVIVLSLLKKKFPKKRIKQIIKNVGIVTKQIIDVDYCEDIILII
jgi:ubiquinone/menaquinone biosynthesis C-methylase UbiE